MGSRYSEVRAIVLCMLMVVSVVGPATATPHTALPDEANGYSFVQEAPDNPGNGPNENPGRNGNDSRNKTDNGQGNSEIAHDGASPGSRNSPAAGERGNIVSDRKNNPPGGPGRQGPPFDEPPRGGLAAASNCISQGLPATANASSLFTGFAKRAPVVENCNRTTGPPPFNANVSVDDTRTAAELRVTAWQLLETESEFEHPNGTLTDRRRQELRDRTEQTFQHYVDYNRVDSEEVVHADARSVAEIDGRAPNVTAHFVVANEKVAVTATDDAEQTFEQLRAGNTSFDEQEVREQIRKANRALVHAQRVRGASTDPASSIVHYRRAWTHAQRALDMMDAETDPDVTVTQRTDRAHNETINYTVAGEVADVRPWQIENVTVSVDGESETVPTFTRNATPGTARFATTLTLDGQVHEITVNTADSGTTLSNLSEDFEANEGVDVLRLDGDGLPDKYEEAVTTTDPLNPDSDAAATRVNESESGTADNAKDFDGDGLTVRQERELGTDPLAEDTDGDYVTDFFEVMLLNTNPLNPDTDGDGVSDGQEDPDGDGLINIEEKSIGANPLRVDSDGDGLDDSAERELGTDPANPDTDDDGLTDAAEREQPYFTDPMNPNTNGNGVLDGDETYTTEQTVEGGGVTVEATGEGEKLGGVSVANESNDALRNDVVEGASASELVDVQSPDGVDVTVAFEYEDEDVADESDLVVARFDESAQMFESLDSTVDAESNTVSAKANADGTHVVLSTSEFVEQFPSPDEVTEYEEERERFKDPGSKCDGVCSSNGDSVTIGVTSSGTSSFDVQSADSENTIQLVENESDSENDSMGTFGLPRTGEWETRHATENIPSTAVSARLNAEIEAEAIQESWTELVVKGESGETTLYSLSAAYDEEIVDEESISRSLLKYRGETIEVWAQGEDFSWITVKSMSLTIIEDSDGDGAPDGEDLCPTMYGKQDNGCPPSVLPITTLSISEDVEEIDFEADVRTTVEGRGAEAGLYVYSEGNGSEALYEHSYRDRKSSPNKESVEASLKQYAGDNVTIVMEARETSTIEIDSWRVGQNSDKDELPDPVERGCLVTVYGCISTDMHDKDTDADDLEDHEEIIDWNSVTRFDGHDLSYTEIRADPTKNDTDEDGLDDHKELEEGWNVSVINTSQYQPYRYDYNNTTTDSMQFYSDALKNDSDDDGTPDIVEVEELQTDPMDNRTYGITEEHQDEIVNRLYAEWENETTRSQQINHAAQAIGVADDSIHELEDLELNDTNDDFDFVYADDGSIVFTALDHMSRTDTWFSNQEELNHRADVDVWDSDTDNDGLTDGQEAKWITGGYDDISGITYDSALNTIDCSNGECHSFGTNATKKDTDGDGYWDGWIGVYGVNNSRNVILYMDRLQDNGVNGSEAVPAQQKLHNSNKAPTPKHSPENHSNLHIGELQWNTNPKDKNEVPDTKLSLEVDYYAGADYKPLNNESWEKGVENNYALYGIEVDVIRDEVHDDFDSMWLVNSSDGFGVTEILDIASTHHTTPTDEYLIVLDRAGGLIPNGANQSGINLYGRPYQGVFTDGMKDDLGDVPKYATKNSPYDNSSKLALRAAKTEIHEIGHSYEVGKADDDFLTHPDRIGEIYSGSSDDDTPEEINKRDRWSIMASGWNKEQVRGPMNGRYFAFSIEELSTIEPL